MMDRYVLRAGMLRDRLTIQAPGPLDGNGNPNPEWVTEATDVPAHVQTEGGAIAGADANWDSRFGRTQNGPTQTHLIYMHYRSTLDATRRFLLGSRVLEIIAPVNDYDSRHRYMVISCRERIGVTP